MKAAAGSSDTDITADSWPRWLSHNTRRWFPVHQPGECRSSWRWPSVNTGAIRTKAAPFGCRRARSLMHLRSLRTPLVSLRRVADWLLRRKARDEWVYRSFSAPPSLAFRAFLHALKIIVRYGVYFPHYAHKHKIKQSRKYTSKKIVYINLIR